jgi:osmotically-inducible protein OsmY
MSIKESSSNQNSPFSLEEDCITGVEINVIDETIDDDTLSGTIYSRLLWYSHTPIEEISIMVNHGYIVLHGIVPWEYQKMLIAAMVKNTLGVKGVINNISVLAVWPKSISTTY